MRYLALGDSYSIGEGVAESGRWPVQLADRLRQEGVALAAPTIVATTGWTTDELSAAMDGSTFEPPYDLVSLLIGVNNQYRGREADDYRGEFQRMLERAIGLAGDRPGRVLVLSIPDWGVTPFAQASGRDTADIARELDVYNAIAAELVRAAGAYWVDITGISRLHPALLAEDGLHPSAAQYTLWTEAALPIAHSLLAA
ncbi:SGNH/GDSL hydrolase family protein [Dyella solisilvae]|uniref:SGNH/GDSL hydrolase family protein n=1 Tax=Dyella solisilvae TaxID=1920168 RepID=A0A370K7F7_9GAMM|nr:SGNH/GDSL hydrolase family protein [Dyella solisilvae]RDI98585.1 SGNH/GDSL hydrolase family protein [Dyella solisilvae]